jgi:hypothetical protein
MKSFPLSSGLLVGENSTEGIGQVEPWMDDFTTVQTEMQASIDSQIGAPGDGGVVDLTFLTCHMNFVLEYLVRSGFFLCVSAFSTMLPTKTLT